MQKPSGLNDFIHPVLNEEIRTISGRYVLSQEKRLAYGGREVLYYIGCAVVDSSCCGPGGCVYARVAGYIESWKYKMNPDNSWVSRVEALRDRTDQEKLQRLIREKEPVQQVNFE